VRLCAALRGAPAIGINPGVIDLRERTPARRRWNSFATCRAVEQALHDAKAAAATATRRAVKRR